MFAFLFSNSTLGIKFSASHFYSQPSIFVKHVQKYYSYATAKSGKPSSRFSQLYSLYSETTPTLLVLSSLFQSLLLFRLTLPSDPACHSTPPLSTSSFPRPLLFCYFSAFTSTNLLIEDALGGSALHRRDHPVFNRLSRPFFFPSTSSTV